MMAHLFQHYFGYTLSPMSRADMRHKLLLAYIHRKERKHTWRDGYMEREGEIEPTKDEIKN